MPRQLLLTLLPSTVNTSLLFYMQINLSRFSVFLSVSLLLQILPGCISLPESTKPAQPGIQIEPVVSPEENEVSRPESSHTKSNNDIDQASFSPETLYSLLVAEISGHRGRLDIALSQYMKQAEVTRDPKVVARANRIARYMRAPKPILDTASLWVEVEPDSIEARQVAAQQLMVFGRHEEALKHVDILLKLSANINLDELIKSASHLQPNEREKLIKNISQLAQKHRSNAKLALAQGVLLEMNKQNTEALKLFRDIHKHHPDFIPALISQARLLSKLGKKKEALTLLAKTVKKHPENIRLKLFYAQRLLQSGELKKAQDQLSSAQALSPDDSKLLFSLGMIYLENDLSEQARPFFERLIKIGKNANDAHFYLAAIDKDAKHLSAALEHLYKVQPGRNFVSARIQIADILNQQDKTVEAAESLISDRKKYPQFSSVLFLAQSDLLTKRERFEESYQLLEQALLSHANHPQLLYSKAMVAEKLLKLDVMEKDLLTIIENDPQNASALNALGYTLADRKLKLDEALTYITRAYTLAPNDPAIIDSMGWVHYRLNNLEKALIHLRKAYQIMPDQEIAAHLGEILWVSGYKKEARGIWADSLKKNPESKILKAVMTRFQP